METEPPVRDERDEEHVDEMKADDDIKKFHEVYVAQSKDVKETHEGENIKAEGSQNVEASITEPEKKPEDKENGTEHVKTEEEVDKSTSTPSVEVEVENPVNAAETPEPPTEAVVSAAPSSTSVGPSATFTVLESTPDAIITPSVEVKELTEVQGGVLVPDVIEKEDLDPYADAGIEKSTKEESGSAAIKVEAIHMTSAAEIAEQAGKPELNIEGEKPEKTMEFKKPTISERTRTYDVTEVVEASGQEKALGDASGQEKALGDVEAVKEKKDESFECDDETLVETSRDLDVVGGESNVNTSVGELNGDSKEAKSGLKPAEAMQTIKAEGSGDKTEETVKADDQSLVEPTKEGVDTKTDVEAPEQKALGDVKAVKEKKDESFEGDDETLVETSRDFDVVGGESNVNTFVGELDGDSKEAKSELKPAEAIQTIKAEGSGDKTEDTVKADDQSLVEPTKEGVDTKTDVEAPEQKALGDIEAVKEKKDESFEGDDETLVETSRDLDVVGGKSNVNTSVGELDGDSKEVKSELKPAEAIQTIKDEGSGDKTEETVKADDQSLVEPTKEGVDTNTDVEAPEQKVIAKTSQRQSNNIISKVKQSIVKVKKAIVGKSCTQSKDHVI